MRCRLRKPEREGPIPPTPEGGGLPWASSVAEYNTSASALRQRIRRLSPHLAPFGILNGKGKVALMFNSGPSPVIRHTGDTIEVISILRPGQRVVRRDTLEIWVGKRSCDPLASRDPAARTPPFPSKRGECRAPTGPLASRRFS
jgi:hypothetical protein